METNTVAKMKTVMKRKKAVTVIGLLFVLLLSACAGKTDNEQAYELANTDESGIDENLQVEAYYDAITRLENTGFLPDDSYCYVSNGKDFHTQKQSAYPNQFAVYDFYEDGLILARVSHAQFMYEDDFWPYEIFQFSADQDRYESIANVEQIDLKANPDYADFPYEYDKDDDKKVYIVNFYGEKYYYDEDAYDDWKEKLLGSRLYVFE